MKPVLACAVQLVHDLGAVRGYQAAERVADDARCDSGAERTLAVEHVLDGFTAELEDEAVQPTAPAHK